MDSLNEICCFYYRISIFFPLIALITWGMELQYKQEERNTQKIYFLLPDHKLVEHLILTFGFYERARKG